MNGAELKSIASETGHSCADHDNTQMNTTWKSIKADQFPNGIRRTDKNLDDNNKSTNSLP